MNSAESRPSIGALRWIFGAAAVVLALVFGFVGYRFTHPLKASPLLTAAAIDYQEEIVDGQSRTWETERASIDRLAKEQGLPVATIIDFKHEGFRLEEGRLSQLENLVYLHLVYTNGAQRFSLFLRQPAPEEDKKTAGHDSIDTANVGGNHVAAFHHGPLIGIVVTDSSGDQASHLARFAAATFEKS